jgi:hypothetical protein
MYFAIHLKRKKNTNGRVQQKRQTRDFLEENQSW